MQTKAKNQKSYTTLLGTIRRVQNPNGTWGISFVWSRIILFLLILAIFFYGLFSIFIYSFFRYYRDYDEMTFMQAVSFPVARSEIRVAMGNYQIETAKQLLKERNFREAYGNLLAGCMRSPKNVEGALILAQLYASPLFRNDNTSALKTLERSLVYSTDNVGYMRLYMQLLIKENQDQRLISVVEKLLESKTIKDNDILVYLIMSASSVYAMHGNYDKSEAMLKEYKLDNSLLGLLRKSRNQWEQGNSDEAIKLLLDNVNSISTKEPIYALLVKYYTYLKDYDKAREFSMRRSLENPFSTQQRLEYIGLQAKSGDTLAEKTAIESFIKQYSTHSASMILLANYAADNGNIDLMRRIYDIALTNNFDIAPYCLLLMESTLTCGQYAEAVAFSEEILKEKPVWIQRYRDVLDCLRAVSAYATGNTNVADVLLKGVIDRGTASPVVLVATARRLESLGSLRYAQTLLEMAVDKYPKYQLALIRLIQLDIKTGNSTNLDKRVIKLLSMRRPHRELVLDARSKLSSDRFIYTNNRENVLKQIDKLIEEKGNALRDYQDIEATDDSILDGSI